MATKQTPATPLPWDFAILGNARAYVVHGAGELQVIAPLYATGPNQDDDAAYIAHAANAYPQLVERARLLCEFVDSMKDCIPEWRERMKIGEEGYTANMRALLRELGE